MVCAYAFDSICSAYNPSGRGLFRSRKLCGRAVNRYGINIHSVLCLYRYDRIFARKHLAGFWGHSAERRVIVYREIYSAADLAHRKVEHDRVRAQVDILVRSGELIHSACVIHVGHVKRERSVLRQRDPARERYSVRKPKDIGIRAAAEIIRKLNGLHAVLGVENVGGLYFLFLLKRLCREVHGGAADRLLVNAAVFSKAPVKVLKRNIGALEPVKPNALNGLPRVQRKLLGGKVKPGSAFQRYIFVRRDARAFQAVGACAARPCRDVAVVDDNALAAYAVAVCVPAVTSAA